MQFLVIDDRFRTPTHVFLTEDPATDSGFPDLLVRHATLLRMSDLSPAPEEPGLGPARAVVGRYPGPADLFRVFDSRRSVAEAGYSLIPSSFIGGTWAEYTGGVSPGRR